MLPDPLRSTAARATCERASGARNASAATNAAVTTTVIPTIASTARRSSLRPLASTANTPNAGTTVNGAPSFAPNAGAPST